MEGKDVIAFISLGVNSSIFYPFEEIVADRLLSLWK